MNWKKIINYSGHSAVGAGILCGVGALAAFFATHNTLLGQVAEAVIVAQALLILGAANLYILVKTPMRDVVSSCADVLEEIEEDWRTTGKITPAQATFARAAAIEAVGRVLAVMLFAGLGLVVFSGFVL